MFVRVLVEFVEAAKKRNSKGNFWSGTVAVVNPISGFSYSSLL
jgi:hypothetical protein